DARTAHLAPPGGHQRSWPNWRSPLVRVDSAEREESRSVSLFRERRVAIAGLGVVSPLGHDARALFDALCRGESGIRPIRRFDVTRCPSKVGGVIQDFDPDSVVTDRAGRRLLRMADWIQKLGFSAAELACQDARL